MANESFALAIVERPWFDFGHQFHRHIEGTRAALGFEGQVPARLGTTGPPEGREAAFDERADLSDLAQGRLARPGVPIGKDGAGVHGWGFVGKRAGPLSADSRGLLGALGGAIGGFVFARRDN